MIKKLILNGGGIHGIAYLGAIKFLEEQNLTCGLESYTGVSVGSIICFLLCIGYKTESLKNFFGYIGHGDMSILNLFDTYGLYNSKKIINLVANLVELKKVNINITFQELKDLFDKELIIVASNLTKKRTEYFCYKTTPDTKVISAIKLSINIPVFFEAIKYKGDFYIDGGLTDNFPIHPVDAQGNSLNSYLPSETIILRTTEQSERSDHEISCFQEYIQSVFNFMISKTIEHKLKTEFQYNTYEIVIKDFTQIEFELTSTQRQCLFDCGYNTMVSSNLNVCSSKSESNIIRTESSETDMSDMSDTLKE